MQPWTFDVADHPDRPPGLVWRETLARLSLPEATPVAGPGRFAGRAMQVISPLGIEITRLDGSPQRIAGRYTAQTDGVWLALLLSEQPGTSTTPATLAAGGTTWNMGVGAIACGPLAVDAMLTLPRAFSLLYVRLPKLALHPRLLGPTSLRVGVLAPTLGVRRVFAGFLQGLGQAIDALDTRQLRTVELALSELLIGSVLSDPSYGGGAQPVNRRVAAMHSICQLIESELTDPDLTMTAIARKHGISPRGLQKLFAMTGQNFSQYLRLRRLSRCRDDLASPLSAHLSISEICFRWGFNDAAHFSRSFRQSYGMTPRAWRQERLGKDET
ncbi:helix-turn-helix domain-containing protein [Tanticharoenia sakaeratensis]|uniref:Transcriptional activator feaR n=1 Tax=Tanticharoenia sakaeratensis NBRC 103193 TaxID=1231623 RepID=A0A0D6MQV7_9PROT|nr:helix-turn-helix domain-containing protein [Tanticharoenia sakaeratensis]GAN55775.1 transcriptional activator feaR [Tanticharoenia sakaeratensis NBRC 103193]GBQ18605.1 AraC family transcriptional regulator [Tanticharoenia sakaeratensis NBRC 103193]